MGSKEYYLTAYGSVAAGEDRMESPRTQLRASSGRAGSRAAMDALHEEFKACDTRIAQLKRKKHELAVEIERRRVKAKLEARALQQGEPPPAAAPDDDASGVAEATAADAAVAQGYREVA